MGQEEEDMHLLRKWRKEVHEENAKTKGGG